LLGTISAGIIGRRWGGGQRENPSRRRRRQELATPTLAQIRAAVTQQRVAAFVLELAMVTLAMVIYFFIRGGLPEPVPEAVSRSTKIIHLEEALASSWSPPGRSRC
jgi:hypothetical protein